MKLPIIRRMRRKQNPSTAKIIICKSILGFNGTALTLFSARTTRNHMYR